MSINAVLIWIRTRYYRLRGYSRYTSLILAHRPVAYYRMNETHESETTTNG